MSCLEREEGKELMQEDRGREIKNQKCSVSGSTLGRHHRWAQMLFLPQ